MKLDYNGNLMKSFFYFGALIINNIRWAMIAETISWKRNAKEWEK